MFEYICIKQARTHVSPRWDCSLEWLSKEQSWSMELAQRHRTALNRSHWGVVAVDPARGGTGLGSWHDTSIAGSLRWP